MARQTVKQGGAIIVYEGMIVLRRNKTGKWMFPKGNVDPGETTAQTALREAEEETGLLVENVEPGGSISFKSNDRTLDVEYFIQRALGTGPLWQRHHKRDTFLVPPDQVAAHLSFNQLRQLWQAIQPRIPGLSGP